MSNSHEIDSFEHFWPILGINFNENPNTNNPDTVFMGLLHRFGKSVGDWNHPHSPVIRWEPVKVDHVKFMWNCLFFLVVRTDQILNFNEKLTNESEYRFHAFLAYLWIVYNHVVALRPSLDSLATQKGRQSKIHTKSHFFDCSSRFIPPNPTEIQADSSEFCFLDASCISLCH